MSQTLLCRFHRLSTLFLAGLHAGVSTLAGTATIWSVKANLSPAIAIAQTTRTGNPPYRLSPGDQIFISVQPFQNLSFQGAINPDGTIVMQLIGAVQLEGLTSEQAQQLIQTRLNQYVVNPAVTLSVLVKRPINLTVTGEVAQPGFYIIPAENALISVALATAGGTTPVADLRTVLVRRSLGNGYFSEQTIDLFSPLQANSAFPDLLLEEGDIVIVPKLELSQAQEYDSTLVNSSNLSGKQPVSISVIGEVAKPGSYIINPSARPVQDALIIAGGTTTAADLRKILVRRIRSDGSLSEQSFDLYTPLLSGSELPDLRLGDGDVVIVPKLELNQAQNYDSSIAANSNIASQQPVAIAVVGEVAKPGSYSLPPSDRPVSDALIIAGGTTTAADLRKIRVRRVGSDGTVSEQSLDLYTPLLSGSKPPDLRLANGDVLIVPKAELTERQDYDTSVVANSNVAAQQPVAVTVLGEVDKPGSYVLNPSLRPVADALLTAGGITSTADLRGIRVRRSLSDGTLSEQSLDFYTPLLSGSDLPDLRLANGDVVFVPKLEASADEDYDRFLVDGSTLAKKAIAIRVLNYPGGGVNIVSLPSGSTFADVLNGISTNGANLSKVALVRFDPEQGRAVTREINAKKLLMGDTSQNVPLQDNDVIVIGRNLVGKITYALNTFTQPFRDVLGFLLFFDSLKTTGTNVFGGSDD